MISARNTLMRRSESGAGLRLQKQCRIPMGLGALWEGSQMLVWHLQREGSKAATKGITVDTTPMVEMEEVGVAEVMAAVAGVELDKHQSICAQSTTGSSTWISRCQIMFRPCALPIKSCRLMMREAARVRVSRSSGRHASSQLLWIAEGCSTVSTSTTCHCDIYSLHIVSEQV